MSWRRWFGREADAPTPRQAPSGPGHDATLDAAITPPGATGGPSRIGHYEVVRKIGQGGMGVVYAARDDRLGRTVAIKTISAATDSTARLRLQREARVAASVSHPTICQIFDIGDDGGTVFIAMELLEGEPLSERLRRGPMLVDEALPVALGILAALQALHARQIVHRDLKPSNVFLTPHGVKLLDFGLARPSLPGTSSGESLTQTGALLGTPRYMSPEQARGDAADTRSDLFSFGAILFEMLAGRPAFVGNSVVEILYATLHEQPPALAGSSAAIAADRVIRRALQKDPAARPQSAAEIARELEGIAQTSTGATARALTRLIVLPFRILRPDPETDFLATSLVEALGSSLVGQESLLIRSSIGAQRFVGETLDLKRIAAEADVDRVLTGTILRAGESIRVSTQLVEAPAGTLVWSHTAQAPVGDVFELQDSLARRILESLPLAQGAAPPQARPHSARAYELYLRGNQLTRIADAKDARELYLQCLAEDPAFAPAWARLGRCHRVIGKYLEDRAGNEARAEEAFRRALELSPDLATAHKLYAHLEAERGESRHAVKRLIDLAGRSRNDPELFAGLVLACRYAGLHEASVAAHREARRLDPRAATSIVYTHMVTAEYDDAIRELDDTYGVEARFQALLLAGRRDEAREQARAFDHRPDSLPPTLRAFQETLRALAGDDRDACVEALERANASHPDPEAHYLFAVQLARLGRTQRGLTILRQCLDEGYVLPKALAREPGFTDLANDPAFEDLLLAAEAERQESAGVFRDAGGPALLGVALVSA
ncbi:MAG TPA: protein kinase [Vicinamibacteria bacterium]|nr:protein kinase [Vicinamibacteria bacterium]